MAGEHEPGSSSPLNLARRTARSTSSSRGSGSSEWPRPLPRTMVHDSSTSSVDTERGAAGADARATSSPPLAAPPRRDWSLSSLVS
ncbi:hypothetical protein Mapa_013913 [Marchantia paleacea]|nr:hypothetical protein Mapa_013913 [Marchantia paleacea]